jgi:uncharacterized cofD-like protein
VFLSPADAPAYPPAVRAILDADAVIVGPGSLFTSLLPVLLIPEVLLALRATRALRIYVCNVATEPGETDHFGVTDHINALIEHIGDNCIDLALVNDNEVPAGNFAPEWQGRTEIVPVDLTGTPELRLVTADIINPENPLRHDSRKLAAELMRLLRDRELYGR